MLGILDHGSGNVSSLFHTCRSANIKCFVTSNPSELGYATHFLLPGVGAFDPTLTKLQSRDMISELFEQVYGLNKPFLGICVGMHILGVRSEEGETEGLKWIAGSVRKIPTTCDTHKVVLPHMGWNSIDGDPDDQMLKDIDQKKGFYFLHSYYFDVEERPSIIATTRYRTTLPCVIRRGNIVGAQFHPEKSHSNGAQFLKNFMGLS